MKKKFIISLLLLMIVSVINSYYGRYYLDSYSNYFIKEIVWFVVGLIVIYSLSKVNISFILDKSLYLYLLGIVLLIVTLIWGVNVNGSTSWIKIFGFSFQPSEFMKIFLIIALSRMITDFNNKYSNPDITEEFKFLLKVLIIVLIPSILTFIEPDTGAVIMYLIITITMLFIGGIRKRWFVIIISLFIVFLGIFLGIYFLNQKLFIKIFGTSFFYRIDRILNWTNSSGLQLNNSLIAIGSSGFTGHGFNNTPIYFPEMQTDFIFSIFVSNFGLIGGFILVSLIIYFDEVLISTVNKTENLTDKYAIGGIVAVLVFQQIYNISMTLGLLPIMGITLPFISYGGSSLLSYMILLGIIFNVSNASLRYTN